MKNNKQTHKDKSPQVMECCQMRAIIAIDKRGQLILPKKLREEVGIKPGDKLTVTLLGLKNAYSILLTRVDEMNKMFMLKIVSGGEETKKIIKE
jgi:AbrB family looped-hinge helix DNA binding protein